jgi:hypothetical protein
MKDNVESRSLENILGGGDLRSLGKSNQIVTAIKTRDEFDEFFELMFNKDRLVAMRSADVIEKVTIKHPHYLQKHKKQIFGLCKQTQHIELQWHLAQLLARLTLSQRELNEAVNILTAWASDTNQSKIVRVNSIQSIFELMLRYDIPQHEFRVMFTKIEKENIPSLVARIKKLRLKMI